MAIRTYSKAQKIAYKYLKNGTFQAKFSGNISSAVFAGSAEATSFQAQLTAVQNLSSSVKELEDYSFYGCYNMVSANLGTGVETIGEHCFENCQKLSSLMLPKNCSKIGQQAFAVSRSLASLGYEDYDKEFSDYSEFKLDQIGAKVIAQTPKLEEIVLPSSVSGIALQLASNALEQASLTSITLLGMDSSQLLASQAQIAGTKLFGLNNDCQLIASDGKKLDYVNAGGALVADESFSLYRNARIQTGKVNKLKLGKSVYWFTQELYQWCMDPTKHDEKKFPSPAQCPFIVFYGDFLTSDKTKKFLSQILESKQFYEWIKDSVKCYLFLLDRSGHVTHDSGSSDLEFFRDIHTAKNGVSEFVVVDFFYRDQFWTSTFDPGDLDDLKRLIAEGMSKCNFSAFNYEPYEFSLDQLDPETIPTSGADPAQLRSWCGGVPWWFSGSSVARGKSRKLSVEKFNFQVLSTPETTYLLVGAYDERNPNDFPTTIKTKAAALWKPYADHFEEIYNRDCTDGGFTKLFEKGPQYRHFICFEFSHGAPKLITIDSKLSYSKIWQVLKKCRGKVFMMFDSCDSGSMFQAKVEGGASAESTSEDPGVASYLIQHFQRRSQLMRSLFGATTENVDPQIICWSSTTASTYGWYYPKSDTIWAEGLRQTDSECQGKRYLPTFLVNKKNMVSKNTVVVTAFHNANLTRQKLEHRSLVNARRIVTMVWRQMLRSASYGHDDDDELKGKIAACF